MLQIEAACANAFGLTVQIKPFLERLFFSSVDWTGVQHGLVQVKLL